ncbi:MAG: UvrD-helicase domain-containing protein [Dorea sp.]
MRKRVRECKEEFWKKGFVNFDDLNILAVRILKNDIGSLIAKRFPVIIIDECQDLSANELKYLGHQVIKVVIFIV